MSANDFSYNKAIKDVNKLYQPVSNNLLTIYKKAVNKAHYIMKHTSDNAVEKSFSKTLTSSNFVSGTELKEVIRKLKDGFKRGNTYYFSVKMRNYPRNEFKKDLEYWKKLLNKNINQNELYILRYSETRSDLKNFVYIRELNYHDYKDSNPKLYALVSHSSLYLKCFKKFLSELGKDEHFAKIKKTAFSHTGQEKPDKDIIRTTMNRIKHISLLSLFNISDSRQTAVEALNKPIQDNYEYRNVKGLLNKLTYLSHTMSAYSKTNDEVTQLILNTNLPYSLLVLLMNAKSCGKSQYFYPLIVLNKAVKKYLDD